MTDRTAVAEIDLLGPESSLADLVDHLLNRGVLITGSITISVAGIDLMYLGLQLVLSSVENLRLRRPN
jgi:hypothetical protein